MQSCFLQIIFDIFFRITKDAPNACLNQIKNKFFRIVNIILLGISANCANLAIMEMLSPVDRKDV